MKIIVDANIVFSGILHTKSNIADLLINSHELIEFVAPDFLRLEIRSHHLKLSALSKLSIEQVMDAEFHVCKDIKFISEEQISIETWISAYELVQDIDEKDTGYIAYSKQFNSKIWSGDKKLISGLKKKGFENFISTDQLFEVREKLKSHKSKRKHK
ncbi:MAG: hypothetical protein JST48_04345 [Bacteroidetes bacterium]|nr:hypothetical protein [Bacteroidota bacterium]